MLSKDEESQLYWYFREADGDCGLKSCQGGQEFALNAASFGPGCSHVSTCWQAKPKRQPDVKDLMPERLIDAAKRVRVVSDRLRQLPQRHQTILQLHYGDHAQINGVGLSLCTATNKATHWYDVTIARRKKATCAIVDLSIRTWISWIAARSTEKSAAKHCLDEILAEASNDLKRAQSAYEKVRSQ
jgi:hypothetical protein